MQPGMKLNEVVLLVAAYVDETEHAELPLGEEFQKHVMVFFKMKKGPGGIEPKKVEGRQAYKRAFKLIYQLE